MDEGLEINENKFLVSSLTKPCHLLNDVLHTKLPIHKGLLAMIVNKIKNRLMDQGQVYLASLYVAFFLTMYFGFFRIGELAESQHTMQAKDVQIASNKRKMLFVLRSSKTHGKGNNPQLIKISSSKKDNYKKAIRCSILKLPCPYQALRDYISLRGPFFNDTDQFFIFADGSNVTQKHLRLCLKMALQNLGFDSSLYTLHGTRAGWASDMAKLRVSVETIKRLGRWKSNGVFKYLKYS